MIRTLAIIAVVSFVLCMGSLAAAFAIAGGPFFIDDHFRFHHTTWSDEDTDDTVDVQVWPADHHDPGADQTQSPPQRRNSIVPFSLREKVARRAG
jgi:hypothetical protein